MSPKVSDAALTRLRCLFISCCSFSFCSILTAADFVVNLHTFRSAAKASRSVGAISPALRSRLQMSNRLQKEITHPKRRLFVVSFFESATWNVLKCQTSSYVFFSCLFCLCVCCFCFHACSLRPANSWLCFLTLVREYSSRNF